MADRLVGCGWTLWVIVGKIIDSTGVGHLFQAT
jgi:hypothetical protein